MPRYEEDELARRIFSPDMMAAMQQYSRMGAPPEPEMDFPPDDLRPVPEGSLEEAATGEMTFLPPLDEEAQLFFPPDDVRGVEPEYDIPGKRVERLPTTIEEVDVQPEGSLRAAADLSRADDAIGQLGGAARRGVDTFVEGARAQQAAAAEERRLRPWDPESTYGRRQALEADKQSFERDQDARLRAEEQNYLRQMQMRQWAIEGWREGEMRRLQQEFDDYKKMDIDPGKAFGDRSVLENAMGVASALLGSLAQFSTGRNPGMEIINRVVEQSIDAQRAKMAHAGDAYQQSLNLYQVNLANRQDEEQAWHQTKAMLYDALGREFAAQYQNRFADKELQQQALEQYEALMAEAAKSQQAAAMAAEKHIYDLAEQEAKIRETLTGAGLNEARIAEIMGKLKGGGGTATGSPQATGAGFANESQIFSHFGFDKPGEVPPSLGDPFRSAGGGIVTEVTTPGREGPESVFGVLKGKALLANDDAVKKLRDESVQWNELYQTYLNLERSVLDRRTPWNKEAVKNAMDLADATVAKLQLIKGAASDKDKEDVVKALGDLKNGPNSIRDIKDEETRREIFVTLRQKLNSLIDSSLSTYGHTRTGKDGKTYEFRVRWRPPQYGSRPHGATDTEAELSRKEEKVFLETPSLDVAVKGADSVYARGLRAAKGDDRDAIERERQTVRSHLRSLEKGRKAFERAEGDLIFSAPEKLLGAGAGEGAVQKRIEQLSMKMRTAKTDQEYEQLSEEKLDLEARLLLRQKNRKGNWRKEIPGQVSRLKSLLKKLDKKANEMDELEADIDRQRAIRPPVPPPPGSGG